MSVLNDESRSERQSRSEIYLLVRRAEVAADWSEAMRTENLYEHYLASTLAGSVPLSVLALPPDRRFLTLSGVGRPRDKLAGEDVAHALAAGRRCCMSQKDKRRRDW